MLVLAGCARATSPPPRTPPPPRACITSLQALLPEDATRWWIVRPRTIFAHPRLGPALGRTVDLAGERALIDRAARVGYDLRTVERALFAETPRGELAVGLGSFDASRIVSLLWDRLLPPRRRGDGDRGVTRVEGMLGHTAIALAVDAACGAAAWTEGETRLVDRVLAPPAGSSPADPAEALVAHFELARVAEAREALGPLAARTRSVDLRGSLTDAGLAVTVTLHGDLGPAELPALRTRLDRVTRSALLAAIGAPAWAAPERVAFSAHETALGFALTLPWAALEALGDVIGGRIADPFARNAQGF